MWRLNYNIIDYLPDWFKDIVELQAICVTEKQQFELLAEAINTVADNFFFQTMDEGAISLWEQLFNIYPNPQTESLDFRRKRLINRISTRPPFTLAFLYQKLDELIGSGRYTVHIDYPNYTLYIEASADNQQWANEVAYTIGKIKPAHIVYVNMPLVVNGVTTDESIELSKKVWNYKLGNWGLGINPFASIQSQGMIVMPEEYTVQQGLLNSTAANIANNIVSKARINGSVIIDSLVKNVNDNIAIIQYSVTAEQAATVTQIELLDSSNNVLTSSPVYIPVTDAIMLKHNIPVEEAK